MGEFIFQAVVVFIFGAAIGSFLNVLIWRLPRDQKADGRSRCPKCNHQLIWIDLLPLLSYALSGGKCRYCEQEVSIRYPLIETVTGLLFVVTWWMVGPISILDWLNLGVMWFVVSVLVLVFVIDLEHYLILDKIVFPATVVVLLADLFIAGYVGDISFPFFIWDSLLGMLGGFLPFYLLWVISKGRWIGLGDAKLGLFLGAVFGFPQILVLYFISFILGTAVSLPLLALGKKEMGSKLPFGTFLAAAGLIMLWFGLDIFSWYMNLIGLP